MDRIERMLLEMQGARDEFCYYSEWGTEEETQPHQERCAALRNEIAADWRAMVEALEGMLTAAIDGDYSYDEHGREWPEIARARATLAHVRGGSRETAWVWLRYETCP